MSQQQNNQMDGATMGLIFIAVCGLILFLFLYALACFASLVFTVIALCALDKPVTIYKWTMTTEEARLFLGCGLFGMIALPLLVFFCAAMFQFRLNPDYWFHVFLGGYALGSLWLSPKLFEAGQKEVAAAQLLLPPPSPPARSTGPSWPPTAPGTPGAAQPFRFASWDDEVSDEDGANHPANNRAPTPRHDWNAVQPWRPDGRS